MLFKNIQISLMVEALTAYISLSHSRENELKKAVIDAIQKNEDSVYENAQDAFNNLKDMKVNSSKMEEFVDLLKKFENTNVLTLTMNLSQ